MELNVKNVEKFFNILHKSQTGNVSLFYVLLILELKKEEIEEFAKCDEEFQRMLTIDKVLAERFEIFRITNDTYMFLSQYYKEKFQELITPTEFKEFTEEIKEIYKRVNYINSALNKITKDIKDKNLRKNEEAKKQDIENQQRISAYNQQIEDDRTHFLNMIIELGMCKAAVKKHLCVDPDELQLKDFFDRYFALKCNEIV